MSRELPGSVGGKIKRLVSSASPSRAQAKQQALMELVVDAHFDILPKHGLEGEEGYVRAQAKMMNFTGDQEIMTSMHGAMTYLQSKAGV